MSAIAIPKKYRRMILSVTREGREEVLDKLISHVLSRPDRINRNVIRTVAKCIYRFPKDIHHKMFTRKDMILSDPNVVNFWEKEPDEYGSWKEVLIVRAESVEQAYDIACRYIRVDGFGCRCSFDCCGHLFATPAIFYRIAPDRFYVVQRGGTNI